MKRFSRIGAQSPLTAARRLPSRTRSHFHKCSPRSHTRIACRGGEAVHSSRYPATARVAFPKPLPQPFRRFKVTFSQCVNGYTRGIKPGRAACPALTKNTRSRAAIGAAEKSLAIFGRRKPARFRPVSQAAYQKRVAAGAESVVFLAWDVACIDKL